MTPKDTKKDNEQCPHHWIIETPEGPTSKGVCKLCGAEKTFKNSTDNLGRKDA